MMRVRFHEGNRITYGQDFRSFRGVPSLWFHCEDLGKAIRLRAEGYGARQEYGNGALYITKAELALAIPSGAEK